MDPRLVQLAYLLSAVLFILGLKGLTRPQTAVRGNLLGACGLFVAVVVTLFEAGLDYRLIVGGLVIGTVIGAVFAIRVQMTEMPQLMAIRIGTDKFETKTVADPLASLRAFHALREAWEWKNTKAYL